MRALLSKLAMTLAACSATYAVACGGDGATHETTPDKGVDDGGPSTNEGGSFGDVSPPDDAGDGGWVNQCKVDESVATVPDCKKQSPPDSFSPVLKWSWPIPSVGGTPGSMVTPLVGNFTDDNGDGAIDLCDVPDVLVTSDGSGVHSPGKLYLLAGDTGALEVTFDGFVDGSVTPAFGDIDGDGLPEVVASDVEGNLVAYEHDGTLKWIGDHGGWNTKMASYCHAIALHDLDGDGDVEIIAAFEVFDKNGARKFGIDGDNAEFDRHYWCPTPTAADLDGDGSLEVIFGNVAMHADGSEYWRIDGPPGQPHVANLDKDPEPEIFLAREDGLLVLEHDGTIKFGPLRLTQNVVSPNCWNKPGAIHDFDGDGIADIAAGSCTDYSVYKVDDDGLTIRWSAAISDTSGLATGTAFDFLGRGIADAIYADEQNAYVFDGESGETELKIARTSGTLIEYPVVADVDNDNSADIVIVSNRAETTVKVFEDEQKRWIPTRRIWNQHAYYVTNVLEDGRIPRHVVPNWTTLNTFRTNAQRDQNGNCKPPPPHPPK